jgi:hypothetical protein
MATAKKRATKKRAVAPQPSVDFDETIDKMIGSARRFDAGKIKADQIARTGGPPTTEE